MKSTTPAMRLLFSVIAGILAVVVIVGLFQLITTGPFTGLEQEDPFRYSFLYDKALRLQILDEVIGLNTGFFVGGLLAGLLFPKKYSLHFLLVPLSVMLIIAFFPWHFKLPKEIIILALPVWALFSLCGYYAGYWIRARKNKEIL